ncbi:MAG TPA: ribosome small subunit-dependent GTPase A [Caulobacteraceae bacterium]|nr:ribosome small subunit-dependent GTPase A [Caulobacteraceae bacterium]
MIQSYGWSDALQHDFAPHAVRGLIPGRILVQQRGLYEVVTDLGELAAQVSGKLAHEAGPGDFPAVGDWVALAARPDEGAATIHALMPRRTAFVRKAAQSVADEQVVAANVDVALLVASMNADFNARRLERYLATAWQSGAEPVVVLTKADLADDPDAAIDEAESVAFGAPVLAVSAVTGEGLEALAAYLKPAETAVLVGSSGVGKSSLVNALAGENLMAIQAIREDDAKGRHTTTHRELIRLPSGALVLDTPGMRELGLIDADEGLSTAFEDIEALAEACRFSDCGHSNEPGCAVREALESGALDRGRWKSFQKLQREMAHLERKENPAAREAYRRHWIGVHKAARAHMKAKRRDW